MAEIADIRLGDKFTIEGHMRGRKGQLVVNGVNPKTKRKCKGIAPFVYTIRNVIRGNA